MTSQTDIGRTTPDVRLRVRRSEERGRGGAAWLDARYSFSFANWVDPDWMGFGPLRVINEDVVQPGAGFPPHGHRDMEIVTWVLDGALEHRDSTGGGGVLRPGTAQAMSAGRGVQHSEFNHASDALLHLLQIWIEPARAGDEPRYQDRDFSGRLDGRWCLIASPDGAEDSLTIGQDARVLVARLAPGARIERDVASPRTWVQVARGSGVVNGHPLAAGDAVFGEGVDRLVASGADEDGVELLLFELP